MKMLLLLPGLIALVLILKACSGGIDNGHNDPSRPINSVEPPVAENDKIVVIKGAAYNSIQQAVRQFCNIYNKQDFAVIPSLTKISDTECLVTFPRDITFDLFCFFVNYMYYPENIFYKADIKAWATTKPDDTWITEKSANKKVMLYIPPDDKEFDNVYLTTEDNIGYKLGFAAGEEVQLLQSPVMKYVKQTKTAEDIKERPSEEVR